MNKEIKIIEDSYLYLHIEYTNSNGSKCELIRRRSNYGRGKCPILKCRTNKKVSLYIDDKLISRDWYSASIVDSEYRNKIHNQLLTK